MCDTLTTAAGDRVAKWIGRYRCSRCFEPRLFDKGARFDKCSCGKESVWLYCPCEQIQDELIRTVNVRRYDEIKLAREPQKGELLGLRRPSASELSEMPFESMRNGEDINIVGKHTQEFRGSYKIMRAWETGGSSLYEPKRRGPVGLIVVEKIGDLNSDFLTIVTEMFVI